MNGSVVGAMFNKCSYQCCSFYARTNSTVFKGIYQWSSGNNQMFKFVLLSDSK